MIGISASDLDAVNIGRHCLFGSGNRYLMPFGIDICSSKSCVGSVPVSIGPELAQFRAASVKSSTGKRDPLLGIVIPEKSNYFIFPEHSVRFYPQRYGKIISEIRLIQFQTVISETNRLSAASFFIDWLAAVITHLGDHGIGKIAVFTGVIGQAVLEGIRRYQRIFLRGFRLSPSGRKYGRQYHRACKQAGYKLFTFHLLCPFLHQNDFPLPGSAAGNLSVPFGKARMTAQ